MQGWVYKRFEKAVQQELTPAFWPATGTNMTLHTINFMREISMDTLGGLQHCVMNALSQGATRLKILLASGGGSTDAAFAAYNFLRSLPIPTDMHCIGNVESMAVVLFLAGDVREIVPHGRVKLHALHWTFNAGTIDHDRIAEFVDSLDNDAERYANIFEERTAAVAEAVDVRACLAGRAKLLNADACIAAGVATSIADAAIPADAVKWWV